MARATDPSVVSHAGSFGRSGGCLIMGAASASGSRAASALELPARAPGANDTVADHRDQGYGKAGDEAEAGIGLAERNIDLLAELARSDHGGDHQHREPGHDGLVQS